ncbi:AP-2 complex subunit mu [Symbiodinium microadriaticum]|uniref:AP-2 complex subunit mu n=1 Tax=Symbiodinium microadriaticum TaxID=2951 RepID=A0A1Q9D7R8_SYMMI|nr:AP-2 complex subunit mu [Symbiodinium microadriaticum]
MAGHQPRPEVVPESYLIDPVGEQVFRGLRPAAMAVVVAQKVRDTRLKRREQEREQREHRLDELFDELDISGDGMLDSSEVKMLLTGMAEGKEPSEEELSFIMKTTTQKPDGDRMPRSKLAQAMESWSVYLAEFCEDGAAGKVLFDKYDADRSGKLTPDELKALLRDLSGRNVSDVDTDWVVMKADVLGDGLISKIELGQAIALWLSKVSEAELAEEASTTQSSQKSSVAGRFEVTAVKFVRPPITMDFEVPQFTASGLRVRFLKVQEKSQYKPIKWIRYLTKAGTYEHRI